MLVYSNGYNSTLICNTNIIVIFSHHWYFVVPASNIDGSSCSAIVKALFTQISASLFVTILTYINHPI